MISNEHNMCLLHKAREEFICVNSQCMDKQRKLSCYKYLEDQHIDHHKPKEDFKSIFALIECINLEKEQRLKIIENAKQQTFDQKKQKRYVLEKSQIFSSQYTNELVTQFDDQYEQFCYEINDLQICLEGTNPQNQHYLSSIIQLYKQNIQEFSEYIEKIKLRILGNGLLIQKQSEITLIESLKNLSEKVQFLEKKIEYLSTSKPIQKGTNSYQTIIIISLIIVVVFQSFYTSFLDSKINQKYQETQNFEIEKINSLSKYQFEQFGQQIQDLQHILQQQSISYKDLEENITDIKQSYSDVQTEEYIIQLIKYEVGSNNERLLDEFTIQLETHLQKNSKFIGLQKKIEQISTKLDQQFKSFQLNLNQIEEKYLQIEKKINVILDRMEQRKNHHRGFHFEKLNDIFKNI